MTCKLGGDADSREDKEAESKGEEEEQGETHRWVNGIDENRRSIIQSVEGLMGSHRFSRTST